jgi:hypothetical protein
MSIIGANNTMLTNELILLPIQTDVNSTLSINNQKASGLQPDEFGGGYTGESIHHPYTEAFNLTGIKASVNYDNLDLVEIDFNKFNAQSTNLSTYNELTVYTVIEILSGNSNPAIVNPIMTSADRIVYRRDTNNVNVFQIFNIFQQPTFTDPTITNYASSDFIRLNNDNSFQIIDLEYQYLNSSSTIPLRAYYNFPSFTGFITYRVSGLILYSGF